MFLMNWNYFIVLTNYLRGVTLYSDKKLVMNIIYNSN